MACHATPVTRAVDKDCTDVPHGSSRADAHVRRCHVGAQPFHKRADVHQGCAGSGCHKDAAVLSLTATRNVCLTCHNDKVNHKSGGECAKCHQVVWTPTAARPGPPRGDFLARRGWRDSLATVSSAAPRCERFGRPAAQGIRITGSSSVDTSSSCRSRKIRCRYHANDRERRRSRQSRRSGELSGLE